MRIRHGGVDRLVRRFLVGMALILPMLLCGRYISQAAGSITKNECRNIICAGGQWLAEAIWNQIHPAEAPGVLGSWPDVRGGRGGVNDPDPAYREHNAAKTFYEEHQYLAWYGNEEPGQQIPEEMGIVASGEADTGGTADAGAAAADSTQGQDLAVGVGTMEASGF